MTKSATIKKKSPPLRGKKVILSIDLNCDLGEGFANDRKLFPYISSANIACGYHAGDEKLAWQTIQLAKKNKVAVGAHFSYLDRENFGRKEMKLPASEIYELVTQQLIVFKELADAAGVRIHHVKPHGALYNQSASDGKIAKSIARAVKDFDSGLILYGLSGSHSIKEAKKLGLVTANEVFADRRYRNDGSLVPRAKAGALIEKEKEASEQALGMIQQKSLISTSGKKILIKADTICIHGDGKHAVKFARILFQTLKKERIAIRPL